jgi:uncharacterized membrane protein YbhN (UPF0104 family)
VVAGFGPFAIGGGFGLDRQALQALDDDEHSARVRVTALGVLEWAVLAPTTCVVAIVLIIGGANIMASLLWPWALAVPAGFAFGLWASAPGREVSIFGWRPPWLIQAVEGMGVMHRLIRSPIEHWGAWCGTTLYWAADITAFYGGLRAFGLDPSVGRVIIAYSTGYAATRRSLPLAGAGVTEGLMTYALYWVRQPLAPALAAVVAYRAFNFLLAAAPALIAHGQLKPLLSRARGRGGSGGRGSGPGSRSYGKSASPPPSARPPAPP